MAIHYENYATFSKRQGFIGAACRPISGQASTKRWFACDCHDCKRTLVGRRVISRDDVVGEIVAVGDTGVTIVIDGKTPQGYSYSEIDRDWAPLPPISELFGEVEE